MQDRALTSMPIDIKFRKEMNTATIKKGNPIIQVTFFYVSFRLLLHDSIIMVWLCFADSALHCHRVFSHNI